MLGLSRREMTGLGSLRGLGLGLADPIDWMPPITRGLLFNLPLRKSANAIVSRGALQVQAPSIQSVDAVGTYRHARTRLITQAEANVLRIEAKGALLEVERIQQTINTEAFDRGEWAKTALTVTADQAIASDGNTTGDELIEDTSSDWHRISDATISPGADDEIPISCWFKANTQGHASVGASGTAFAVTNPAASFDLVTGVAAILAGAGVEALRAYTDPPINGWRRCTLVVKVTNGAGKTLLPAFGPHDGSGAIIYTGASKSIFAWGAMSEFNAGFAGSYIPAVASPVTRAVTDLRYSAVGNLVAATSTIFCAYTPMFGATYSEHASIFDTRHPAQSRNGIYCYWNKTALKYSMLVKGGTTTVASINSTSTATIGVPDVITTTLALNDFGLWVNGIREASDLSGGVPNEEGVDTFFIGQTRALDLPAFANIAHYLVYDRVLTAREIMIVASAIRQWMGVR